MRNKQASYKIVKVKVEIGNQKINNNLELKNRMELIVKRDRDDYNGDRLENGTLSPVSSHRSLTKSPSMSVETYHHHNSRVVISPSSSSNYHSSFSNKNSSLSSQSAHNRLKIERRKPNWTECENVFLLDQFAMHREILTCKATDASTNLRKQEIWRLICSNLNRQNVLVRRTPAEVRRKWKNLVTAAKKELWEIRHSIQVTGLNKKLSDLSQRVLTLHQGQYHHAASAASFFHHPGGNGGNPSGSGNPYESAIDPTTAAAAHHHYLTAAATAAGLKYTNGGLNGLAALGAAAAAINSKYYNNNNNNTSKNSSSSPLSVDSDSDLMIQGQQNLNHLTPIVQLSMNDNISSDIEDEEEMDDDIEDDGDGDEMDFGRREILRDEDEGEDFEGDEGIDGGDEIMGKDIENIVDLRVIKKKENGPSSFLLNSLDSNNNNKIDCKINENNGQNKMQIINHKKSNILFKYYNSHNESNNNNNNNNNSNINNNINNEPSNKGDLEHHQLIQKRKLQSLKLKIKNEILSQQNSLKNSSVVGNKSVNDGDNGINTEENNKVSTGVVGSELYNNININNGGIRKGNLFLNSKYHLFSDRELFRKKLELQIEILKLRKIKLSHELFNNNNNNINTNKKVNFHMKNKFLGKNKIKISRRSIFNSNINKKDAKINSSTSANNDEKESKIAKIENEIKDDENKAINVDKSCNEIKNVKDEKELKKENDKIIEVKNKIEENGKMEGEGDEDENEIEKEKIENKGEEEEEEEEIKNSYTGVNRRKMRNHYYPATGSSRRKIIKIFHNAKKITSE